MLKLSSLNVKKYLKNGQYAFVDFLENHYEFEKHGTQKSIFTACSSVFHSSVHWDIMYLVLILTNITGTGTLDYCSFDLYDRQPTVWVDIPFGRWELT